ncbi:DEAD-box ATP-dependent RNA helicase 34 [Leucoagaricus sp. SymC.cos]|nr:DEAD-box ATP-dependent RNA helicase 34 [Leucoagaricus sp. SymC.cos]
MARSAALNPASMPFFPGSLRGSDTDGAITMALGHQQDRSSLSSLSVSPSEYRSAKSSPSPSIDRSDGLRHQTSPGPLDGLRRSPTFRQVDAARSYPNIESRAIRENSMLGTLESLPEADDNQENGALTADNEPGSGAQTPRAQTPSSFVSPVQQPQAGRERLDTPPVAVAFSNFSFTGGQRLSASPVSSLGSASQFAGSTEGMAPSFDAQLKTSSFMHDLLDRLVRCEYSTREIQRDLNDIQRKVTLLLERALTTSTQLPAQPEFKDPFANGNTLGSAPSQPRPSIGNIAPNQQAPPLEDMPTITQRLNALTTSVGQLLALQTQQMQQTAHPLEARNSIIGLGPPQDIAPNQLASPPALSPPSLIGHTLSNRPDLRPTPRQQPTRTWSSGTLDLPNRASESAMSRQEPNLRDKSRRSVSGLLRRDSSGIIDAQGDYGNRDNGPIVTKWDQLQLAPELLRSLSKFGVGPPNKIQQRALPFLLKGADIIAQAPPTQERIAAYVIPAIQIAVTNMSVRTPQRGPIVIMVSTTVDQATQAQRMIRDLGGPIGIRSALGAGTNIVASDLAQELRLLQQNIPHIICGTPQKLHALFTTPGGLIGSEVRFLVLDEVDQLIARNLHDFVFNIVKLLPPPRSRPVSTNTPNGGSSTNGLPPASLLDATMTNSGRRLSTIPATSGQADASGPIERQTALFSNTVPQDVLNLASAIHLKEPVRVLVRRDGNNSNPETSQGSRGLRQYYLYLAFTAGSRGDPAAATSNGGLGIIGSGRGGATSAETAQAREWKLDALADLFDDIEIPQAIVHVGGMTTLDAVVYKLASRGFEAVPLHADMNNGTKLAAINKFRSSATAVLLRQSPMRVLVVYDVQVKSPEVPHVPLVVNYDLPKAVEEYAHRVAPAMAPNYNRTGVVINFVTATGGDVEMLRSIECHYKWVPFLNIDRLYHTHNLRLYRFKE